MTTNLGSPRRFRWLLWAGVGLTLLVAVRCIPWDWFRDRFLFIRWVEGIQGNRWAVPIFVAAYTIGCLFAPITPFTIAGGVLFGFWKGTFLSILSPLLGATLAFWIARLLGRDAVRKLLGKKAMAMDEGFKRHGFTGMLIMRLTGVPPFILVNYMAGLSEVSLGDYVLATFLGSIHWTLFIVYFSHSLWQAFIVSGVAGVHEMIGHHSGPIIVFVLALVIVLTAVIFFKSRRRPPAASSSAP